jgi:hypothetical protein
MSKIPYVIQSYINCLGWVLSATAKWIWEECPDLKLWNIPTHPSDFIWFAERVNGRLAMLVLSIVLWVELVSGKGIFQLICG